MFRILESQAPAKQNATTTISTLSTRLQSATLLEDRRAAILGLRSFAKLYPASVASGALRNLIACLNQDIEDADTTKITLETLLMLFSPDDSSPEASEDIALWLADEFTQRQENITALLDLLDSNDFYPRLYALQLISAISTARPERTQECVYTAPLGVSRLVAVLEDKREAVRSEGLLLLSALTPSSPDIQKLVAFESAFDRIFAIIEAEGSLSNGGVTVQDCLSLLAILLNLNSSNQSCFRETGSVKKFADLLEHAVQAETTVDGVSEWTKPQRDKNVWGLLAVIRLFLIKGGVGTPANQASFWQNGVLGLILEIAFLRSFDIAIRAEALRTVADLIQKNTTLQEQFAQLDVPALSATPDTPPQVNGHQNGTGTPLRENVIASLLDLALVASNIQDFSLRLAACDCLKAYLNDHAQIRLFFLRRAIQGYTENESDNILSILVNGGENGALSDPYRYWIAAVILFHLLFDDDEAKSLAMAVKEGDAENGEEVITCIQALSANLLAYEQHGVDERPLVGYLMDLSGWLFEDHDAVNDFLGEASNIQSLMQIVARGTSSNVLVPGLCAFLLGIIYEFSTKDSPLSRSTLHQMLTKQMSRDLYVDRITKLREHPLVRDFEVTPQGGTPENPGGLPDVFFDKTFVEFLKDNFSRILRAIDRQPGFEVPVIANGVQKGISRELVDTLRAQIEDNKNKMQQGEEAIVTLERKLSQEQADHRKAKESATLELTQIKKINDALQRNHEEELSRLSSDHDVVLSEMERSRENALTLKDQEIQQIRDEARTMAARAKERDDAEIRDLKSELQSTRAELEKANKDHAQDLRIADENYTSKINTLEARLARAEEKASDAEKQAQRYEQDVQAKGDARDGVQAELDDLLVVLGDLEEKRSKDKARLKELGEAISDDDDEAAEEEEEEQDNAEEQ